MLNRIPNQVNHHQKIQRLCAEKWNDKYQDCKDILEQHWLNEYRIVSRFVTRRCYDVMKNVNSTKTLFMYRTRILISQKLHLDLSLMTMQSLLSMSSLLIVDFFLQMTRFCCRSLELGKNLQLDPEIWKKFRLSLQAK